MYFIEGRLTARLKSPAVLHEGFDDDGETYVSSQKARLEICEWTESE